MSTQANPVFSRVMSRCLAAVGAAAVVSALTLTACSPRDPPAAAAATAQTVPTTTAAPADATRAGTPVPPAPTAALAPAPAVAPPPLAATPATPAPQGGYAATPAPVPAANVDNRPAPAAQDVRVAERQAAPIGRLGSIESIEPIRERPKGSGAGAVIGGVAGAVIGNQFGSGLGRAAMTGLGAAGGAVAGNNVERNMKTTVVGYRIHVRLDDGHTRVFERSQIGNLHVGDRLRVDGSSFHRV